MGGHDIPEDIIHRRYKNGLSNLINLYVPNCDFWMIIDNSKPPFSIIAEGNKTENIIISDLNIYNQITYL
jgi:predicted ABC-type ATPase